MKQPMRHGNVTQMMISNPMSLVAIKMNKAHRKLMKAIPKKQVHSF